jgi:hypothetical protein
VLIGDGEKIAERELRSVEKNHHCEGFPRP